MKHQFIALILAVGISSFVTGCGDKAEVPKTEPAVSKPKVPKLDAEALSTEIPAQPAVAETVEAPPVPAEVQPVQDAVEAFKEKNNRYPNGIQELVDQKLIALPKLPAGKAFFVNPSTGRVVVGSNP